MKPVKEFVLPSIALTLICLIVSAALVFTYQFTKPFIDAAAKKAADEARVEMLPEGDSFTQLTIDVENVVEAYEADNGAGYVFTTKTKGYGGEMQVMVGISSEGLITGVKLMDNSETAGLGSRVGESAHTQQYIGKDSSLEGIEKISGASISSAAFKTAVEYAYNGYASVTGNSVGAEETDYKTLLFPEVTEFNEITVEGAEEAYTAGNDGFIIVTKSEGYNGDITVWTGLNSDGTIAGVVIGDNDETPGLGSQVEDSAFTDQFVGQSSADGVENIAGATYSSNGVKAAVTQALDLLDAAKEAVA